MNKRTFGKTKGETEKKLRKTEGETKRSLERHKDKQKDVVREVYFFKRT
jgi:hypothetical protein